jgi:hypothetical protein
MLEFFLYYLWTLIWVIDVVLRYNDIIGLIINITKQRLQIKMEGCIIESPH